MDKVPWVRLCIKNLVGGAGALRSPARVSRMIDFFVVKTANVVFLRLLPGANLLGHHGDQILNPQCLNVFGHFMPDVLMSTMFQAISVNVTTHQDGWNDPFFPQKREAHSLRPWHQLDSCMNGKIQSQKLEASPRQKLFKNDFPLSFTGSPGNP